MYERLKPTRPLHIIPLTFKFELLQFTNSSTAYFGILHKIVIFDLEPLYLLLCTYLQLFLQVCIFEKLLVSFVSLTARVCSLKCPV